jgi:hypothetical protein
MQARERMIRGRRGSYSRLESGHWTTGEVSDVATKWLPQEQQGIKVAAMLTNGVG